MTHLLSPQSEDLTLRKQSCPNKACTFYGCQREGNIIVHSHAQQRWKCTACGRTWVSHKHSFYYGLRSDPKKILSAVRFLEEGVSVRAAALRLRVSPSTIQRWKKRMSNNFFSHTR